MRLKNYTQRHPVLAYFIGSFSISWIGAFVIIAPKIFAHHTIPKMDGILMFPIMLTGPATVGIFLTRWNEGKTGLRQLIGRMFNWKIPIRWYLVALFAPPCLILMVLVLLQNFDSPAFHPNFFMFGLLFGLPAGALEEIGWTGYAFPKMRLQYSFIKTSLLLGLLWGLWHLPVIDFLGAASPHGHYLVPFALAFIAAMMAIRIIICWLYSKTNSLLLAQLAHTISTSALVVLGPPDMSPAQEALWYTLYAALLWSTAGVVYFLAPKRQQQRIQSKNPTE